MTATRNPDTPRRIRVLLVDDDEDDFLLTRETVADIPGGGYSLEWESDFDAALGGSVATSSTSTWSTSAWVRRPAWTCCGGCAS